MSIEYRVLSSEYRVGGSEIWEGCSEEKNSPFEGGKRRRRRGMTRECTTRHLISDTTSTLRESSPMSNLIPPSKGKSWWCSLIMRRKSKHTPKSPLQRGLIPALILVLGLLSLFAQPVQAQSTNAQQDTPLNLPLFGETYSELEGYLQIAIEHNPGLQSMRAMVEADRERVREVGVLMDPEINIAFDFNPMMANSYLGRFSISAMQMFPWFGTLGTRRDMQRYQVDANRSQVSSRQLEILRDVQITWFDIAEIHQQIRTANENLELLEDLQRLVEVRYETGRAGQADILRIQMEEQRLRNRIEDLEDQINPLKAQFNELLNREPFAGVETPEQIYERTLPYSRQEINEWIMNYNPAFDELDARKSSIAQQRHLAKLEGRPSFGLGLEVMGRDFGPMSMFPDANESIIGMATVRVPIFRSRTHSQVRQAEEQLRSLNFQRDQTENRLTTDLEFYLEEIRRSERYIRLLDDELIPRIEQALTILSEEYSAGNARFDELLQIQRELLDLEFERVEAVVRQNQAVVKIENLMGGSR